jgi:hypothetical protein
MDVATKPALNKYQAKRLRYYFEHRRANCRRDGIDLDLVGMGYIALSEARAGGFSFGDYAEITEIGIAALHAIRQADIAARSVHHDLGSRLAIYLRKQGRITWENIEFSNRVWDEELKYERKQFVRPDVYSIFPSLNLKGANPCVHEVKVSRADFMSDLAKPEKRGAYAMMAEAVYYVAPEGVIHPSEVPQGIGLLVERSKGEFVLTKRPRKRKIELQSQHYLNMIVKPGMYPEEYGLV